MNSEPSVHDNFVYAYVIDCERRRIVLHTTYRYREPHEFTDVVFEDVTAHHFEHSLSTNILFDVEEADLETLIRGNATTLEKSWRYGWPPVEYRGDLSVLIAALRAASVKAYNIQSSYGLAGWVLARSCQYIPRAQAATFA